MKNAMKILDVPTELPEHIIGPAGWKTATKRDT